MSFNESQTLSTRKWLFQFNKTGNKTKERTEKKNEEGNIVQIWLHFSSLKYFTERLNIYT